MFDARQLKAIKTNEILKFGNGYHAKLMSDKATISLFIKKRIATKGRNDSPKTLNIAKINLYDEQLNTRIFKANQRALEFINLMSEGQHPLKILEKEKQKTRADTLTLKEGLDLYERKVITKEENVSKTIKDRRSLYVNHSHEWLNKPMAEITTEMIHEKYLFMYSGQGIKRERQAELFYVYLRAIYNYLNRLNILNHNPTDALVGEIKRKRIKKAENHLLPSEIQTLIRYFHKLKSELPVDYQGNYDVFRHQQYNILHFLLFTGLRLNEVLNLKWSDVYFEGSEIHENPYFVLVTSKQQEEYAIPITQEISKLLKIQKKFASNEGSSIKNLADLDILDEDGYRKLKQFPKPKYVFMSEKDLKAFQKGKQDSKYTVKLEDNPPISMKLAYKNINKIMPDLYFKFPINALMLRHTFATIALQLGYSSEQLNSITGHARQDTSVATSVYLNRLLADNRDIFENIQSAMLGSSIEDRNFKARPDKVSKKLESATDEEVYNLFKKGMLTAKEETKYLSKIQKYLRGIYDKPEDYGEE